jgi:hypothetical protein
LKLEHLGISQSQSKRWQQEAMVPDEEFDAFLRRMEESNQEITGSGLLRLARRCGKDKRTTQLTKDRKGTPNTIDEPQAIVIEVALMSDYLEEMRYHRNLLEKLLDPVCSGRCRELRPSELAHIRRLLSEIQRLLGEAIESIAAG